MKPRKFRVTVEVEPVSEDVDLKEERILDHFKGCFAYNPAWKCAVFKFSKPKVEEIK